MRSSLWVGVVLVAAIIGTLGFLVGRTGSPRKPAAGVPRAMEGSRSADTDAPNLSKEAARDQPSVEPAVLAEPAADPEVEPVTDDGWTITGRVVDSAGRGVKHLTVLALNHTRGVDVVRLLTADDGRFQVPDCAEGGVIQLDVIAEGHTLASRYVVQGEHAEIVISVPVDLPRARLRGRLIGPDGEPLEKATLLVVRGRELSSVPHAHDSADGEFAIEDLFEGDCTFQVYSRHPKWVAHVFLAAGQDLDLGDVLLAEGGLVCAVLEPSELDWRLEVRSAEARDWAKSMHPGPAPPASARGITLPL